ncbi:hypothetical protein MNV49_006312 [Pseudohyphozyma bogoriensis]|nr:hypothetical protein MNV49_006312 [Pseudohyphozyma bogoriensis]
MKAKINNANFPTDAEGRVYHISTKRGEIANRIITAGDPVRIRRFAKFLDETPIPFECVSARGFTTITGRYKGVPVSLIAIGMGYPMMDFLVREARHIVDGDMAIIRFGSCGSIKSSIPVGSIGVPKNCMAITSSYDHFEDPSVPAYHFSKPIPADPNLHGALLSALAATDCQAHDIPLHASGDSFYGAQGRIDSSFADDNLTLLDDLSRQFPDLCSLEMETTHLFHLARLATPSSTQGTIHAAAAHMIFASRSSPSDTSDPASAEKAAEQEQTFIDPETVAKLEPAVGRACLDALVGFEIPMEKLHPETEESTVWRL